MLTRARLTLLRRLRREEKGLAAVEFALILPVMIAMLFGMTELSAAIFCRADVTQMASTAADLVAQKNTISASDLQNVYNAANIILYPYYKGGATARPAIRITSVTFDAGVAQNSGTQGRVAWTCTQTGNGALSPASRNNNATVTLDKPLLTAGGSVLMAEVAYDYAPPNTQAITGTIHMRDAFYTRPRRVAAIPAPATCP